MLPLTLRIVLAGIAGLCAGCTFLPSSGPMATDIANQESIGDQLGGYVLIDMTERVVSICATQPQNSLRRVFKDTRPAPDINIGVGDSVSVTIWEAASGGLFS